MIDKEAILKLIESCIFHQNETSGLNFLELIKFKLKQGHLDIKPKNWKPEIKNEKCKWEITGYKIQFLEKVYKVECNPDTLKGFLNKVSLMGYKYCNYCGKEIEEIEK